MDKLIITAALCGSVPTKEQNPHVPYSPREIAEEGLRCWRAGAVAVHVHVRDPQTGAPAFERHLFAEVLERLRAESDLIVNLTTSAFNIDAADPGQARLMPVDLGPDLCSLDVGSLNFRGRVFSNPPDWVERAAAYMKENGVKPEMEAFEVGHVVQAADLVARGLIADPPWFQLCLGIAWGAPADLDSLLALKARLPQGAQWSVLGTGASQLAMTTHAMLLGGHVRVGFEDNLYLSRGVKADSNARFVERTASLANLLGRPVASCAEARQILRLPQRP